MATAKQKKEKLEEEIKRLNKAIKELQEKNIELDSQLLTKGKRIENEKNNITELVETYIDFFYLGWKKTPNIKKNYSDKNQEEEEEEQKDEENLEENQIQEDQVIPRHDFNLNNLENFYYTLKEAEDNLRKSELEGDHKHDIEAIDKYNSIRNDICIKEFL